MQMGFGLIRPIKIPSLQTLHKLFIGRMTHILPEQWKRSVLELLKFNINTQDDDAKWKKSKSIKPKSLEQLKEIRT